MNIRRSASVSVVDWITVSNDMIHYTVLVLFALGCPNGSASVGHSKTTATKIEKGQLRKLALEVE
jgi:hypothetical protein